MSCVWAPNNRRSLGPKRNSRKERVSNLANVRRISSTPLWPWLCVCLDFLSRAVKRDKLHPAFPQSSAYHVGEFKMFVLTELSLISFCYISLPSERRRPRYYTLLTASFRDGVIVYYYYYTLNYTAVSSNRFRPGVVYYRRCPHCFARYEAPRYPLGENLAMIIELARAQVCCTEGRGELGKSSCG